MISLPDFARVVRRLPGGEHRFEDLLPLARKSPALRRIVPRVKDRNALLATARVLLCGRRGYAFVDVEAPRIVLSERYYARGSDLDVYLDLLHELTHLRQIDEGFDLWDDRFEYVERPTEVEAYAVAVEEGRRLGMTPVEVQAHLKNPWMTRAQVARLLHHVDGFLAGGALPNLKAARAGAPFQVHHPWRCTRPTTSTAGGRSGRRG